VPSSPCRHRGGRPEVPDLLVPGSPGSGRRILASLGRSAGGDELPGRRVTEVGARHDLDQLVAPAGRRLEAALHQPLLQHPEEASGRRGLGRRRQARPRGGGPAPPGERRGDIRPCLLRRARRPPDIPFLFADTSVWIEPDDRSSPSHLPGPRARDVPGMHTRRPAVPAGGERSSHRGPRRVRPARPRRRPAPGRTPDFEGRA
jgi:hypothetical protein